MRSPGPWLRLLPAAAIAVSLAAQTGGTLEFEVVSIKPGDPTAVARMGQPTPGGFRERNLRLFELIMGAWGLNRDQIVGGPNWLDTAGWDIDARFPPGAISVTAAANDAGHALGPVPPDNPS